MLELFERFKFFKFGLIVILQILLEMGIYLVTRWDYFFRTSKISREKKKRFEIVRTIFFTEQTNFPIGFFFIIFLNERFY